MKFLSDERWRLMLLVVLCHLSIPFMFAYATPMHWVLSFVWAMLTIGVGFSVISHRLLSHRSFKCPKWLEYVGSLICVLGVYGPPITIVAMHREHHRYSDTEQDVHYLTGWRNNIFARVYIRMFFEHIHIMYAKDLLRSKYQRFLQDRYLLINFSYLAVLLLIDPMLAVSLYLFPGVISYVITGLLTVITHYNIGYRNNNTPDKSNNHWFLTLFAFGEGLHNNHHAYPNRANFSQRWWELDLGYLFIKLFDRTAK